jgi:DNA (cytosine-5)-methyltransferase 1
MRYLSVCAGIEAATVAWHHMGWEAAGYSEIEKFPSQVLEHHYPNVPKLGDMTKYKEWNIGTVNLLVGGTPCQSFSVAGLRKGMADPRGNLALVYCGILDHFRPQWFVWENVPGVLSSNGGRDFGSFLGAVAKLGYGFAYRVLDAQWFGVAQRRRRVFVVGCLGDWRRAAAVLFERQSLRWDLAPSREKREITPTLTKECTGVSRTGHNEDGWYIPAVAPTLDANEGNKWGSNQWVNQGKAIVQPMVMASGQGQANISVGVSPTLTCIHEAPIAIQGNLIGRSENAGPQGVGVSESGAMYTLTKADVHGVAQTIPLNTMTMQGRPSDNGRMGLGIGNLGDPCPTLTKSHSHAVAQQMAVRRLTPTECERLQGFPDGYTDIQPNGKQTPDGPRYKALGNSMAVPVMKWIGERIDTISAND